MGIRYFNTMDVFMRRIIILLLLTSILLIAVSAPGQDVAARQ